MANVGTGVEEGGMVMMVGVVGDREEGGGHQRAVSTSCLP